MNCRNCGNELRDGALFCNQCGTPVNEDTPVEEPVPVAEKNEERTYKFKNLPKGTWNVWDILFSGEASFCVTYDKLVIREETAIDNIDKVTSIPYNEIVSFKFRLRFSIWMIIVAVFMSCLMISWLDDDDIFYGLLSIPVILICLINAVHPVFTVDVSDGRRIKIKLRRTGRKLKKEKENFIADLSKTLNGTYVLQNVKKSQSCIKVSREKRD